MLITMDGSQKMKLLEHLKKRRDELAKILRLNPNEINNREEQAVEDMIEMYNAAYADLMAEVQPLLEALERIQMPTEMPIGYMPYECQYYVIIARKAIADWQKKFGGVE